MPAISVVIPTFDRCEVLERAIDSIRAQDVEDVEIVVVDDGSTDGTARLLTQVDDRRVITVHQANRGVSAARNSGIRRSTSDFVTFLDSDDEAGDGWLRAFLDARAGGADLVFCGAHFVGPGAAYKRLVPEQQDRSFGGIRALYLAGTYAIDKELLLSVGSFRDGLRFSENTDLGLRLGERLLASEVAVSHVDEPLLTMHRSHRPYDPAERYESAMVLLDLDLEHLRRSRHAHATYLAIAGVASMHLGQTREARQLLREAIRIEPWSLKHVLRLARTLLPGQPGMASVDPEDLRR